MMNNKFVKQLYKTYKERCLVNDQTYVPYKTFKKKHDESKNLLLNKYQKMSRKGIQGIPYCVIRIDENWCYWAEIRDKNGEPTAVVNIITPEQYEYILGNADNVENDIQLKGEFDGNQRNNN